MAHDGPSALELAKTSMPDVVLLDIGLPGMDGCEVARHRVREDATLVRSRLVAISGYGRDEDHRRSHEVGFDAHLVKPIDFDEIKKLLARLDTMVSR